MTGVRTSQKGKSHNPTPLTAHSDLVAISSQKI